MKNKTILIIDDSRFDRKILSDIVSHTGNVPICETYAKQALELIKKNSKIDLILLDIVMEDMSGYDFLKIIKHDKKIKYIPIVLISGLDKTEDIVKGLDLGAFDYIKKPFIPLEVKARINVALRTKELQDALIVFNEKLKHLAITDSLTGLYNHNYLIKLLKMEFKKSKRYGSNFVYMMIDIDKFKSINDLYGHLVGDNVLIELSNTIRKNLRDIDYVGRYGGEEFGIILPNTDIAGSIEFAKRLSHAIETMPLSDSEGTHFNITISIGISSFSEKYTNCLEIIRVADDALYKAKEWGRSRIVYFKNGDFFETK